MKPGPKKGCGGRPERPPLERFLGHVMPEPNSGCWLWTSFVGTDGYAVFFNKRGLSQRAHRFSYEQFVGPIPDGLVVHHRCSNTECVNPDHLEAVTNRENILRGRRPLAERTHCKHGHEYTPANTRHAYREGRVVGRVCLTCHARLERERRARLRAAA